MELTQEYPESLLERLRDRIAASFGYPRALERRLATDPVLVAPPPMPRRAMQLCVALTHWQRWSEYGYKPRPELGDRVHRWHRDGQGNYRGGLFEIPGLKQLTCRTEIETWAGDIRDIEGISASKSPIDECDTLDEFAERYCRGLIQEIDEARLMRCWSHERRFVREDGGNLSFGQYAWDGRTFWLNEGGSHNFAAARYLAAKLERKLAVKGRLYQYELVPEAVLNLLGQFYLLAMPAEVYEALYPELERVSVTHYWAQCPQPMEGKAIFLPRAELRAQRVAELLIQAGVLDLGTQLLADLHLQQQARHPLSQ